MTSIRKVQWQSFRLNFFFIVQPEADRLLPISYIGNFALADRSVDVNALTQQLAQQAPGVLLIDARRILTQVQTIMSQASWAVSGLYGFTLLASLIVLFFPISVTLRWQTVGGRQCADPAIGTTSAGRVAD